MGWIINLLYLFAAAVAGPRIIWRYLRQGKSIAGWREKFSGRVVVPPKRGKRIWLHAVSVGEVNLIITLLPRLRQRFIDWDFIVSTTTQTGHELAVRKFGADEVCFLPFDFTWSVSEAFCRIQPDLIVLAELEIWPNLLRTARRRDVPIAVINGRLSDSSFCWYRRVRWLIRPSFQKLAAVAAQNELYAQRFIELGVEGDRIVVTGNMKFDGARSDRDHPNVQMLGDLFGRTDDQVVWLAGSTQEPEERIVIDCFDALRQRFPQLRLVIAPRHPDRCDSVLQMCQARGLDAVLRSKLGQSTPVRQGGILIIDTVGELAAWWGICQIAFVGGSLGNRGGQNMIEPSAFGCAVAFGPNTKNFRDAVALLMANDAASVVQNAHELQQFVEQCLLRPAWREQLGIRAQQLVFAQTGATERTIERLWQLMEHSSEAGKKAA